MSNERRFFLMNFFSRFSYPQQFMLISLIFSFSILTSTYFMLDSQNMNIKFTYLQIKGIEYQQAILKVFENIPAHRILVKAYLQGDASKKSDILLLESKISAAFKSLINFDQVVEKDLKSTFGDFQEREILNLKPEALEKKWNEIYERGFSITPETSDREHLDFMRNLTHLMNYIGDTSDLRLDSFINTYYLISIYVNEMPSIQNWLPEMHALTEKPSPEKKIDTETKNRVRELIILTEFFLDQIKKSTEKALGDYKNISDRSETENHLKETLRLYIENTQDFLNYLQESVVLNQIEFSNENYLALANKMNKQGFILWEMLGEQIERILKERLHQLKIQQFYSMMITVSIALIAFLIGLYIMREISGPLTRLLHAANNLAKGDLSTRVPLVYNDEVGQMGMAFNQMAESFQELIGQLQWAGIQLTTSTTQIAAAAKEQEETVVQQEATTKEIAVTASEISTTAKEFAKTMNEVSATAEHTSSLAASGKAGLNQMEVIMHQMVEASGNIASKLAVLNEKAGNITSVVTTISKVADQTNLLSLNAAIEAEKAGEHGRSFAVIAREIRRLADQTGNATLDIERMINEMVSAVSAGVMGVDKFSEEIHTGVNQLSTVSEHLTKIIEKVQEQTGSFKAANEGMQAQWRAADQINNAISQLSEIARQTTEALGHFGQAIRQLNNAAQEMQSAVIKLKPQKT